MWSDPIERALLIALQALELIQRGHQIDFGMIEQSLRQALSVREQERASGQLVQP